MNAQDETKQTVTRFRHVVKDCYPAVTIKLKTVSFSDLARANRVALTIDNATQPEVDDINALAKLTGIILPDTRIMRRPTHREA